MPFVRMGTMGDPSEDWEHTLNICSLIKTQGQHELFHRPTTPIVIVTKHWKVLSEKQLKLLPKYVECINTSISAIDDYAATMDRIKQYKRLKHYCKSILRVVTFDFNLNSKRGRKYNDIQEEIINKYNVLETVFRTTRQNRLVVEGIINITKIKFLRSRTYVSKRNPGTYMGYCRGCPDVCGLGIPDETPELLPPD
jgi:hypothetical protein